MDLINSFTKLTKILNFEFSSEEIFNIICEDFQKDLGFDFVMVGYLNACGIEIKLMSDVNNKIHFSSNNIIGKDFQRFLNENKGIIFKLKSNEKSILDELGIKLLKNASVILLPLAIKNAVFGIVLGIKFTNDLISQEIFALAQSYADICSYIIKDAELKNVFKLQTKILNDNVIEKTSAIADLKEQNERIRTSEKIKTEFLANMSHSLRTPLNAIIGFSEALQMKAFGELNNKQEEYILDIQNSGKEMLGMVNDILDMAKIEAGAMNIVKTQTDICLLIKEAVNIIKSLSDKKNIKIETKLPKNSVNIDIDVPKINQVLFNLLSNAVKFTNENGHIKILLSQDKHSVKVSISDSGTGIDKKYHEKIFDKFAQIENPYGNKYASTGLGLTITKKIIDLHNGKIRVESELNKGATFIFELPKKI